MQVGLLHRDLDHHRGPLALVRNQRPEELRYGGAAQHLAQVWIALRAQEREVLERTTIGDVVAGRVPGVAPSR